MLSVEVEERFEKLFVLVVLLEELLAETTLLGCKVEQFPVVELAVELLCELLRDDTSSGA